MHVRPSPLLGLGKVGSCDFTVGNSLDLGHGSPDDLEKRGKRVYFYACLSLLLCLMDHFFHLVGQMGDLHHAYMPLHQYFH